MHLFYEYLGCTYLDHFFWWKKILATWTSTFEISLLFFDKSNPEGCWRGRLKLSHWASTVLDNGTGSASSNIKSINSPQGALELRMGLSWQGPKHKMKVTWRILIDQIIVKSVHEQSPISSGLIMSYEQRQTCAIVLRRWIDTNFNQFIASQILNHLSKIHLQLYEFLRLP
jgi:hypothetical protein